MSLDAGVGHIVIDGADDIDRLERLTAGAARRQPVLLRVTPGVRGDTHEKISTGQADSKFGVGLDDAPAALDRIRAVPGLDLRGLHIHIGSQLFALEPFRAAIAAIAPLGEFPTYDLGGGLGVAYTDDQQPPPIEEFVARARRRRERAPRPRAPAPDRARPRARRQRRRHALPGGHGQAQRLDLGRRSTAACPTTCGRCSTARATAPTSRIASAAPTRVTLSGKHCESGDVVIREALLDDPRPGDVVVTPATGAYGHAMANNYNGVTRPPVIFCADGEARVVVARETLDDLHSRDV